MYHSHPFQIKQDTVFQILGTGKCIKNIKYSWNLRIVNF